MKRLISLLAPHTYLHWAGSLLFWGLCVGAIGYVIEVAVMGELDDTIFDHFLLTLLISAPFVTTAMLLIRHLDNLQRELQHLASTDQLTGLPNRRAFFEHLQNAEDGILLMLDIDHFKQVNDTYGHLIGDFVLQEVASKISCSIRPQDKVGRIGGEEFAVFLKNATQNEGACIGQRIANGINYYTAELDSAFTVTISVGASNFVAGQSISDAMRCADEALYNVKRTGRAYAAFYDVEMKKAG